MRGVLIQAVLTAIILFQLPAMYGPQVIMSIRFVTFENPSGTRSDGQLCDQGEGSQPCDHYFIICLDKSNGDKSNETACQYSQVQAGHFMDTSFIQFDNYKLSFPNPVLTNIPDTEAGVLLKVKVWDYDPPYLELVDMLSYQIDKESVLSKNETSADSNTTVIPGQRTMLRVDVSAFCAEHHFLRNGSCRYCKARDDDLGHFNCSEDGDKICLPDFIDVSTNCTVMRPECLDLGCLNGGTCDNLTGCICPQGFEGFLCSNDSDECVNGTGRYGVCSEEGSTKCENLPGSYKCHCKPDFSGRRCQFGPRDDNTPSNDGSVIFKIGIEDSRALLIGLCVGFFVFVIVVILIIVLLIRRIKSMNHY